VQAVRALVSLLLLAAAPVAYAGQPPGLVVGLAPAYAYVVLEKQAQPKGGGASLFLHYHLTSAFALRLAAGWSGHDIEGTAKSPGGTHQVVNAAFGLRYAIDSIPINPALEGGVGILYHRYQKASSLSPSLQLGIACDYFVRPWISVGAAFHYHAYLSNPSQYPVYFDAGPRVGLRWP
jgi:hypothetical protein